MCASTSASSCSLSRPFTKARTTSSVGQGVAGSIANGSLSVDQPHSMARNRWSTSIATNRAHAHLTQGMRIEMRKLRLLCMIVPFTMGCGKSAADGCKKRCEKEAACESSVTPGACELEGNQQAAYFREDFLQAFFTCYNDNRRTNCARDLENCYQAARAQFPPRAVDMQSAASCRRMAATCTGCPNGGNGLGCACVGDGECQSAMCVYKPGSGMSFCSQPCTTSCPAPLQCSNGYCFGIEIQCVHSTQIYTETVLLQLLRCLAGPCDQVNACQDMIFGPGGGHSVFGS